MAGMGTEMEVSMPVLHTPVDTLRKGLTSLATETAEPHPVQTFQATRKEREFAARIDTTARLYGVAAAMRLKTEKEIMSQVRRPPGLPSSMVALETVLGDDEIVDFEDYMNDPLEKPDVPQMLIHDKMEQLLKM